MQSPHVIGERIYLRPLERSDAPVLRPWFNDPEVTAQLALRRPVSLDFEEEFIAHSAKDEHRVILGIARKGDDVLIGTVGLEDIDFVNRLAQYGLCIGVKEDWGKGYGRETTCLAVAYAFEHLNLHRVYLHVYETHLRAIRTYESAGFRKEGVLRQSRWDSDHFVDTVVMGLLRQEWLAGSTKV